MRNKYIDGDLTSACAAGCDLIQLKYDGNWCQTICDGETISYLSDTDRLFYEETHSFPTCTIIGELMRGTQWSRDAKRHGKLFVFDLWGGALNLPYRKRYALLKGVVPQFPTHWELAPCFKITDYQAVWDSFVMKQGYEGVIFRRSDASGADSPIIRQKREYELSGVVIGFIPGEGKHTGRLGALIVRLPNGTVTNLGNGFSDEEREHIWNNKPIYFDSFVEFTANAVFTSGSVRHARFLRWKLKA